MQGLGRDLPKFQALGAEVYGVSYDNSKTQHAFAIHCAANFPFLSDDGHVAARYDSAGSFGPFKIAKRRTFVVDHAGTIRFVYDGVPDDARILRDLATLARSPQPQKASYGDIGAKKR